MNLRRSIDLACAKHNMRNYELAKVCGFSAQQICNWRKPRSSISMRNAEVLAQATGYKLSEFIALGED